MVKKLVLSGELFTNRETSAELYDARVEEILLLYEKRARIVRNMDG